MKKSDFKKVLLSIIGMGENRIEVVDWIQVSDNDYHIEIKFDCERKWYTIDEAVDMLAFTFDCEEEKFGLKYPGRNESYEKMMSDEGNPAFLFQGTHSQLVRDVASGVIDANYYARKEMANRGLGEIGQWIGFEKSSKLWKD